MKDAIAEQPGLSIRKTADKAGLSEARVRQIINGYTSAGRGQYVEVFAPAETIANLMDAVKVPADEVAAAGREDAAELLRQRQDPETVSVDEQDERVIKMKRPAGMTVEEWKRKADELEEEIEWKLNRAAKER